MKQYILGVDGGNTKTDWLLFDTDGTLVDGFRAGTCSHEALPGSFAEAGRVIGAQVTQLLGRNGLTPADVAGAAFGLAGADLPHQKARLRAIVAGTGLKNFAVDNDGFLGLKAGTPEGWGVCSINGTATVAVGEDRSGSRFQVGGLGAVSSDDGGGEHLAREAVAAVYDSLHRVGRKTALTGPLCALLGTEPEGLAARYLSLKQAGRLDRTGIIRILLEQGEKGDPAAAAILTEAGIAMARSAAGCIRGLGLTGTVPVVLAGSVWANAPTGLMIEAFKNTLDKYSRAKADYILLTTAPAAGAILWAWELARNKVPGAALRARILKNVDAWRQSQPGTR